MSLKPEEGGVSGIKGYREVKFDDEQKVPIRLAIKASFLTFVKTVSVI